MEDRTPAQVARLIGSKTLTLAKWRCPSKWSAGLDSGLAYARVVSTQ